MPMLDLDDDDDREESLMMNRLASVRKVRFSNTVQQIKLYVCKCSCCNFKLWEVVLHALVFTNSLKSSWVLKTKCINTAAVMLEMNRRRKKIPHSYLIRTVLTLFIMEVVWVCTSWDSCPEYAVWTIAWTVICKEKRISCMQNVLLVFCKCLYTHTQNVWWLKLHF